MADENPSSDKNNDPSTQQIGDCTAKAITALESALIKEAKTNRTQEGRESVWDRIIGIATLVFVILTTVGIFYQAHVLNNTDHAIHISSKAATDAVEATKEAMRIDQRAWLGVEYIRSNPLVPEIGKPFIVEVHIKNTGKTPAIKIASRGRGEPVLKGRKPNFSYEGVEPFSAFMSPGAGTSTTVPPMTIPQTNQSIVINDDLIKGLTAETFTVFVHGRFDYEDIFGNPHWITYCANLVVPFNGQFDFCAEHNDSDDYQPNK
jgi:hypothetical protein